MFINLIGILIFNLVMQSGLNFSNFLFSLVISNFDSYFKWDSENCQSGLDKTLYVMDLVNQIKLNTEMKLPQRYIGSIFLKYGGILNISSIKLIDAPTKLICANKSLGAVQVKLSIDQVVLAYGWSFGEKCEGIAKTQPQDIFVDLNLEKNEKDKQTRLISSYTSALTKTDFRVIYKKCNYLNVKMLENQVKNVCKKAALHDVDLILQAQIKSFATEFIDKNELFLF